MNSYYPFIISGCVTLLAVYLSHRSRMKLLRELKNDFETTTHQPAESIKTHKPTEEYIKFLEKPSKKKELRKFRLSRPSSSAFKTFLLGILIWFIVFFMMAIEPNSFRIEGSNDSNTPVWFASMGFCLVAYALYLNISAIIRAFYKFVTSLFRKTNK